MTTRTPTKNEIVSNGQLYLAVTLPESPGAASPNKNLTGLPRVAKDIAADVYNNIQKWNEKHVSGAQLIKKIAALKANNTERYPDGLQALTQELFDCVQTLSIYSNALIFLTSQIKALVKLHKQKSPLFISMDVDKISDLIQEIGQAYKMELRIKEYVLENISHSRNKDEVMFHAACWTHQQHVTSDINLKVEALLTETGHRKIT